MEGFINILYILLLNVIKSSRVLFYIAYGSDRLRWVDSRSLDIRLCGVLLWNLWCILSMIIGSLILAISDKLKKLQFKNRHSNILSRNEIVRFTEFTLFTSDETCGDVALWVSPCVSSWFWWLDALVALVSAFAISSAIGYTKYII